MKTAILLSGKLRDFKNCYPSLRHHILDRNDCDLFLQAYAEEPEIDDAICLYKPRCSIIEKEDLVSKSFVSSYSACDGRMSSCPWQWRNWKAAFSLVPSQVYDCVVRCRYDLKFDSPLDFSKFDMNEMNIPMGADWLGGICDVFAFSSYKNMMWYMTMTDLVDAYIPKIGCHPETVLKHHLNNNPMGFPINRYKHNVYIRRGIGLNAWDELFATG